MSRAAWACLLLIIAGLAVAGFTSRADRELDRPLHNRLADPPKPGKYQLTGSYVVELMAFDDVQKVCPPNPGQKVSDRLGCVLCSASRITLVEPGDRRIRYVFREVFEEEAAHCHGYRHQPRFKVGPVRSN